MISQIYHSCVLLCLWVGGCGISKCRSTEYGKLALLDTFVFIIEYMIPKPNKTITTILLISLATALRFNTTLEPEEIRCFYQLMRNSYLTQSQAKSMQCRLLPSPKAPSNSTSNTRPTTPGCTQSTGRPIITTKV